MTVKGESSNQTSRDGKTTVVQLSPVMDELLMRMVLGLQPEVGSKDTKHGSMKALEARGLVERATRKRKVGLGFAIEYFRPTQLGYNVARARGVRK